MKKLTALIGAGILALAGCATTDSALRENEIIDANEIANQTLRKFGIPRRFESYKDKAIKISEGLVKNSKGRIFYGMLYDLGGDKRTMVGEAYQILMMTLGGCYYKNEPIGYFFDLNNNGQFDEDELLIDDNEDGLNGNERWVNSSNMAKVL